MKIGVGSGEVARVGLFNLCLLGCQSLGETLLQNLWRYGPEQFIYNENGIN
jgi:hypothetical protein